MRDVNYGWLIRYIHANTASFFFIFVYMHIGRGIYYGSYKSPRVLLWSIGVIIFVLMIGTAFLGYIYSPKWHNLFLNISLFYNSLIINSIFIIDFYITLFTITIFSLYLNNWRISNITIIKYFQVFNILLFFFIILYYVYIYPNYIDFILCANDKDIDLHGHVTVTKEAGEALKEGMTTVGAQIGLGASIVGVSSAVSKAIVKSGMPPLQKATLIIGGGLIGGIAHSQISALNRNNIESNNSIPKSVVLNTGDDTQISRFLSESKVSPLQEVLLNSEILNYTSLSIIYILIIQLIFKIYFQDIITLKLSSILGNKFNNKSEYYLNKIIKINKQMGIVWIWFAFILVSFVLIINAYTLYKLNIDLYSFIEVHIPFIKDTTNIPIKSIGVIILELKLINYSTIISLILLMIFTYLKFHLNREVNNKYIWLLLLIIVVTISYSAYTYGDLYSNIDSYVYIHNKLK